MRKMDIAGVIFFTAVFTILSFNIHAQENFATSAAAALSFTDITLSAGTGGPTASGKTGGHGAMFCDVDNDGRPDLYITMLFNEPMKDLFFRNTGNNVFANEGDLRGISDFDGGSHGAAFADLDNDGDYDLINGTTFAATGFPATNDIFRNDGSGFFTDVTGSTGIPFREWPTRAATAFDMDKDGDLDLFFVTGPDGSGDPAGERNEVYRNDGNFQFTAINSGPLYTAPAGQGATDSDYDGDGDIDVFAGNRNGDVNILRNDGSGNFTLITPASIGITHRGRDGITLGDIDNDDDLDMMLASPPDAALYRNNGSGTFSLITTFANVDGYMGGFADLDNDTDLDLVFAGDSKCYLNNGSGAFSAGPAISITGINDPRAVAFADIDNDGDLDFAFGNKRSRNWLVRNNFNAGNWLKIKLVAVNGQVGAFGAKTRIYPAGQAGGTLLGLRESRSNNGYLGQDDPILHFGLGSHTSVDVVVNFLDGITITRSNISSNQTITIDTSGSPPPDPPIISSFNPTSGPVGTLVTITGDNFTGANSVKFNNVAAAFNVESDSVITASVPTGATTGKISVTNSAGTGFSADDFTVTSPPSQIPVVSSFTPTSGPVDTVVTIIGDNFTGAISVKFNNVSAAFTVVSDSVITATVPIGATTGKISVTNSAGIGTSIDDFVITGVPPPQTLVFNPTDDAFVWSAKPTNNYGPSVELRVRKTSETQIAYFKFNVTGLSGTVASAKLRLMVTDGSPDGGSIYVVSNNFLNSSTPWTEGGLIWPNAPAVTGSLLSKLGSVTAGQTVEYDVTAAITSDGIYSFAIKNSSGDVLKFSSKEGTKVPELEIQTGTSTAIAVALATGVDDTVNSSQKLQIPGDRVLYPIYPNPFNLETTIQYHLPEAVDVRLAIYNLRGQEVRALVDEHQSAGFKTVRWDGRDHFGQEVGSGTYFARLTAGRLLITGKLILQK